MSGPNEWSALRTLTLSELKNGTKCSLISVVRETSLPDWFSVTQMNVMAFIKEMFLLPSNMNIDQMDAIFRMMVTVRDGFSVRSNPTLILPFFNMNPLSTCNDVIYIRWNAFRLRTSLLDLPQGSRHTNQLISLAPESMQEKLKIAVESIIDCFMLAHNERLTRGSRFNQYEPNNPTAIRPVTTPHNGRSAWRSGEALRAQHDVAYSRKRLYGYQVDCIEWMENIEAQIVHPHAVIAQLSLQDFRFSHARDVNVPSDILIDYTRKRITADRVPPRLIRTQGGILVDSPGTGKTIELAGLVGKCYDRDFSHITAYADVSSFVLATAATIWVVPSQVLMQTYDALQSSLPEGLVSRVYQIGSMKDWLRLSYATVKSAVVIIVSTQFLLFNENYRKKRRETVLKGARSYRRDAVENNETGNNETENEEAGKEKDHHSSTSHISLSSSSSSSFSSCASAATTSATAGSKRKRADTTPSSPTIDVSRKPTVVASEETAFHSGKYTRQPLKAHEDVRDTQYAMYTREGITQDTSPVVFDLVLWSRMILDEGHLVNCMEALQRVQTLARWYVSGTPFPSAEAFQRALEFIGFQEHGAHTSTSNNISIKYLKATSPKWSSIDALVHRYLVWRSTKSMPGMVQIPPYELMLVQIPFNQTERFAQAITGENGFYNNSLCSMESKEIVPWMTDHSNYITRIYFTIQTLYSRVVDSARYFMIEDNECITRLAQLIKKLSFLDACEREQINLKESLRGSSNRGHVWLPCGELIGIDLESKCSYGDAMVHLEAAVNKHLTQAYSFNAQTNYQQYAYPLCSCYNARIGIALFENFRKTCLYLVPLHAASTVVGEYRWSFVCAPVPLELPPKAWPADHQAIISDYSDGWLSKRQTALFGPDIVMQQRQAFERRYDKVVLLDAKIPENLLEHVSEISSKMNGTIQYARMVLEANPTHRIILFSRQPQGLVALSYRLMHAFNAGAFPSNPIKFGYNIQSKNKALREFHSNPAARILVLDERAAASGLDLVQASHVFVCEFGDNITLSEQRALDEQLSNRIHRVNQIKSTYVVRFIMQTSFESALLYKRLIGA